MLTHSLRDTSYSPSPSLRSFSSCQRRCEIECWASPCIVVFIFSFPNLHMCIFENFALYKDIDPLMYLSPDLHVLVTKNPEGEEDKEEQDEEEGGGEKSKASNKEASLGFFLFSKQSRCHLAGESLPTFAFISHRKISSNLHETN